MSGSGREGEHAPGSVVSPRVVGVIVTAGVIVLPGIPVGYLTPFAIFLGLCTVYVMEARKYRRETADRRSVASDRLQVIDVQSVQPPEAVHVAGDMAAGKPD